MRRNAVFVLLVAVFCAYATAYIYRTSFVIEGKRYFSLFDDAMISMRYARNLAHGDGLRWNPGGEKVEGYTNPLWVLYMALWHLLPIDESKISLVIQITGAILLVANLYLVRRIAHLVGGGSERIALAAVLFTAFYMPIDTWSLQGMEVSVLTALVSLSLWWTIRCLAEHRACPWLFVVLGGATLVRPDMVVPLVGFAVFLGVADRAHRRVHLISAAVSLAFFVLVQTAFRQAYFGEWLPNTYYLKMTGYPVFLRVTRGLYVLLNSVWSMNPLLFAAPFVMGVARRDRYVGLLLWILGVQMLYSVWVGGDAWEGRGGSNRYMSIAMPGFFVAFSWALARVMHGGGAVSGLSPVAWARLERSVYAGLVVFALVDFNGTYGPRALAEWLLIKRPLHARENQQMVRNALLLRRATDPRARIGVVWAGALPYFSHRYAVDLLGKNDKHIAREKMHLTGGLRRFVAFYPGHLKYDYAYSIGVLRPDVVAQVWHSPREAAVWLDSLYLRAVLPTGSTVYLRRGSPMIRWPVVRTRGWVTACGIP